MNSSCATLKRMCRKKYSCEEKKVCTPAEETVKVMTEKEDLVSLLQDIKYSDTAPFVAPIDIGKVIDVYDGDTITIASVLSNTTAPIIYRFTVRLSSIDTPEIGGQTPEEKRLAILARDALYAKLYGKIVTLKNVGTEKYGRVLADVYLNEESITEWLLINDYGVPYDGGVKVRPESWGVIEN